MKRLLPCAATIVLAACLTTFSSCHDQKERSHDVVAAEGEFVITGQLPAQTYDSACLYLVPMQGPHPRPVDSVFVGQDGRFEFRGNVEQMAVLRMTMKQRMGIQDLLVVTEPGVTWVTLDSVSSSHGTPQNDALQQWKEHLESMRPRHAQMAALRKQLGSDNPEFKARYEAFRQEEGQYNYDFLKAMGRNTLTVFLNKMFTGSLDSLRRAELNELLKDTTDYTQPQPGFRR